MTLKTKKEELEQNLKERKQESRLENIEKNVRMIMYALTHEYAQESINKINKEPILLKKQLYETCLQILFIFLSILLGVSLQLREYTIVYLIVGIILLLIFIRLKNIKNYELKLKTSPNYNVSLKLREKAMKNMENIS